MPTHRQDLMYVFMYVCTFCSFNRIDQLLLLSRKALCHVMAVVTGSFKDMDVMKV